MKGILGYSEGAMTAATLILEERRRWEEHGTPRRIKVSHLIQLRVNSSDTVLVRRLLRRVASRSSQWRLSAVPPCRRV